MKGQKTGGRTKGTPNRATAVNAALGRDLARDGIIPLLGYYMFGGDVPPQLRQGKLLERLERCSDRDAVTFLEKLMQYAVPKRQAASVDIADITARRTIEDALEALIDGD